MALGIPGAGPRDLVAQLGARGYVVLKDFFPDAFVARLSTELDSVFETIRATGKEDLEDYVVFEEDPSTPFLVADLARYSPFFSDLSNFSALFPVLERIFNEKAFVFEFGQAITKAPLGRRKVNWHRDYPNGAIPRKDPRSVRTLICLDAQTTENGGLMVIKDSHLNDDFRPNAWGPEEEVTLSCPAGSLILLGPKLLHGGPANQGRNLRRVITLSWAHSGNHLVGEAVPFTLLGTQPGLGS